MFDYAKLHLLIKPSSLFAQTPLFSVVLYGKLPLLLLPDFPRLLQKYNKGTQTQTVSYEVQRAEG